MDIVNNEGPARVSTKSLDLPPHHTAPLVPLLGRNLDIPKDDPEQIAAEKGLVTPKQEENQRVLANRLVREVEKSIAAEPHDLNKGFQETQTTAKAVGEAVRNEYQTLDDFRKKPANEPVWSKIPEKKVVNESPVFDRQALIRDPVIKAPPLPWYRRGLLGKLWF